MKNNSIVFLHLSDMHLNNESDISDEHINKIVNSLNSYKSEHFGNVIIILSGDITNSGEMSQINTVKKMIGSLIVKINFVFHCRCYVLVVPGNHDVNHNGIPLDVKHLSSEKYSEIEIGEHKKLEAFYTFAKYNKCFKNSEIYYDIRPINIDGFKIQVNLINNAIFSTIDQYKGLLYISNEDIATLSRRNDADFVISVMHHAPDYYRDQIKNKFEDMVVRNSNILFHGHEHYNFSKQTLFDENTNTIVQSGGCLCHDGDWSESSYIVGILNTSTFKYVYHKYTWNQKSEQYEHNNMKMEYIRNAKADLNIEDDFLEFINENNNDSYFVFPSIVYHGNDSAEDYMINTFEKFKEELFNHHYSVIVGSNNIGKTTLLKQLFKSLAEDHYVLYASPEKLIQKSNKKKHNIEKLIKSLFIDIYGVDSSRMQSFEQSDKQNCVFILDGFEQVDGINMSAFFEALSNSFGTIIISNTHIIDFDPYNINIDDRTTIARFEMKSPIGHKRRELIRAVVRQKADDKSEKNIENIVQQIDLLIKTQLSIIPPEPYYIIQISENFMNNVGEAIYKSSNAFSKVFEANLTNRIDNALNNNDNKNKNITVDLMYTLFGKIAYYIHFQKAYPIKRSEIDAIITDYNTEYGNTLETEDIIYIAKLSKIIINTEESRESFRFCNKSILAYFVAKEIIYRKDNEALLDIVNKACINICTDILLFIIYLTEDTSILNSILTYIKQIISTDPAWEEFSIPNAVPQYIKNCNQLAIEDKSISKKDEKEELEKAEENTEETMVTEFNIRDIYDWDDSVIESYSNKIYRMTSLLQITAKCLPCFEHRLKKDEKNELIGILYTLPNRIFTFWSKLIEKNYDEIIEDLKRHPYSTKKKSVSKKESVSKDNDEKTKTSFALFAISTLLNMYYIPVLNATGRNTIPFLNNTDFFDYSQNITHQLEHLMYLEQIYDSDDFITEAIALRDKSDEPVFVYMLQCIVRHAIITRNDTKDKINRLESKFFPKSSKALLIERIKQKNLNK